MKYTIYDPNTFDVLYAMECEEQPKNSTDLVCMENFITPKFNPTTNEYYEGATFREIVEAKIQNKIAQNAKRRQDGIEAYERVASEMDAYVELGIVTQAQFEYISDTMKPVRAEIVMGRWKEGLDILITLQPKLDTTTYNKFYKIITDYLAK
jgi:hypothetical protein